MGGLSWRIKVFYTLTAIQINWMYLLIRTGWTVYFRLVYGGSDKKNLPAEQEIWFQSLAWEDPLEKRMATHSSILAWRVPWMEEPGGLPSIGSWRVVHSWVTITLYGIQNTTKLRTKGLYPGLWWLLGPRSEIRDGAVRFWRWRVQWILSPGVEGEALQVDQFKEYIYTHTHTHTHLILFPVPGTAPKSLLIS